MSLRALLALSLCALLSASATGQDGSAIPSEFLICYPNAPGSVRAAEPIMARLGQYLSDRTGSPLRPSYFNALGPADDWLESHQPHQGILSLSLYLRWHRAKELVPLAHAERGGASEERYRLLVRQDAPQQALSDFADPSKLGRPARIWSAHLDDPRFATNVVFQGQLMVKEVRVGDSLQPAFAKGSVRVVSTTHALNVLRRLQRQEDYQGDPVDAVLVDATVWSGLAQLKRYEGVFRVVYTSPALPTPPVVRFAAGAEERSTKLAQALIGMGSDPAGEAILKSLLVTAFTSPQTKRLAELVAAYEREIE